MPTHHTVVEVVLPEAETLADLYGIVFDLDITIHLCSKLEEVEQDKKFDYLVREAMASAAIIRYFRCISSGVRFGVTKSDIEMLPVSFQEIHEYLKGVRDKYIAHSVNAFENTFVTTSKIEADGEKPRISGLNPGQNRVVIANQDANNLKLLSLELKKIIEIRVRKEEEKLHKILESFTREDIDKLQMYNPLKLNTGDVNKARKQKSKR